MPFQQLTFIDNSELIYNIDPQYFSRKSRKLKIHSQSKGALCWYYTYKILGSSYDGEQLTKDTDFDLLKLFKKGQLRADTKAYIVNTFFDSLLSESVKDSSDAMADLDLHLSKKHGIMQLFIKNMTGNGVISKAMIDSVLVTDIYNDIVNIKNRLRIKSRLTHEEIRTEVNRYKYTTKFDEAMLLTFLKDNGPTAVPGQFGSMFYSEQPASLSRMLGNRHLYSWRKGTRKDEVTEAFSDTQRFLKTHNIIIIGVKINQEDPLKSHVYFVDPNYTSEPSKAFIMSFSLFLEKMDPVNQVVSASRPRS